MLQNLVPDTPTHLISSILLAGQVSQTSLFLMMLAVWEEALVWCLVAFGGSKPSVLNSIFWKVSIVSHYVWLWPHIIDSESIALLTASMEYLAGAAQRTTVVVYSFFFVCLVFDFSKTGFL